VNREYHKWFSPRLGREMELLVFGHAGTRVLVFPTREGRFFDYENWGMVAALAERIERGDIQLFCVDSLDAETFYCRGRATSERLDRHRQYEGYLLDEVLPLTREKNPSPILVAHGCSIGAYHAVTLTLRHPEQFSKVVGFSGRYDLCRPFGPFPDLFDGHYENDLYYFTPTHFIPGLSDAEILSRLRRLEIVLAVGGEDPFAGSNRELSQQLNDKRIGNSMALWDGEAHRAKYWREMVRAYL
jgi:esterase/lipase superfamily enzyme